MYLKKLELQGFKSFPEKIRLDFNKGITAVVGPNGSGKSNISDAIRWVLGEQSAKSLRGAKMEDVIFAGTQNRRSLGFAEVSMTIDNSDSKLNIDFSEITVARRVYRSGESQFFINGSQCRLKDIHELFMDTGIGREGYSIIGQGRIDEILSVKSEDRRLLFEEVAGIVKYKNRKKEAENKLEKERQNLIRVNDIILELEGQIGPLSEQSEKAKKYLSLSERLKLIDIHNFVTGVAKAEAELNGIDENISGINDHISAVTKEQERDKETVNTLKAELSIAESNIEAKSADIAELRSDFEKKESDIKLCHQKIEYMENDKKRLFNEISLKNEAINTGGENKIVYESRYDALNLELRAKNEALNLKQLEFDLINEKLSQSEEIIDKFGSDHIEKLRLTSDIEGKLQRKEALYEQLEQREEALMDNKNFNQSKINDNSVKLQVMQKDLNEKIALQNKLNKELQELYAEKDRLAVQLEQTNVNLEKVTRRTNDCKARHKLLTELENTYEGYYKSVKAVLKQKKLNPGKFSGICGAVGELINVGEEYETAIEIALGAALQNIVTENEKDAQMAIEYLKISKEGRATFLPVSTIKGKDLGQIKRQLLQEKGIIGIAKELISYAGHYEQIMANLLGKVLVADNIENAVSFSKKYSYQYKLVTLEGEIINPGGSLTGGSITKSQSNILSRGREIAGLYKEIGGLESERDKLSAVKDDLLFKISSITEKAGKNKFIVREAEVEKASLGANITQVEKTLGELTENQKNYDIEEHRLMEQIAEINKEIRELREQHRHIEKEIEDIVKNVDSKQSSVQQTREERENISKELTNIKVQISSIEGNISSVKDNINRVENDLKTYADDISRLNDEISNQELQKIDMENKIYDFSQESERIKEAQARAANELEQLMKQKEEKQNTISEYENESIKKIELAANLKNQLIRLEMKKEQSETNNRRIYDDMWESYSVTYQEALKYPRLEESRTELDREARNIKNEVKALGAVNVNAIEEYRMVKERFEFLESQRNDIVGAEEKLMDIMRELTELMEIRFKENFKLISENFSNVFAEMFGGGTAYLRLSDESDILESGIEIISQPPGKILQNMMLFSGGERALTAIALLFAILRMKPTPFCILDEIESALDDANVKRYADYLKNFADDTQFILITHRKGTMEAADILYGVTMQEQGVSKLVSVNFAQEERKE